MAKLTDVLIDVTAELESAVNKFPSFHSAHEAFAVLKEEVDELWEAVRIPQGNPIREDRMTKEAIQVAAMAIRFILDMEEYKN